MTTKKFHDYSGQIMSNLFSVQSTLMYLDFEQNDLAIALERGGNKLALDFESLSQSVSAVKKEIQYYYKNMKDLHKKILDDKDLGEIDKNELLIKVEYVLNEFKFYIKVIDI